MSEEEYITNINTEDLGDEEVLEKLKKAEAELTKVKSELDEKSKLCLDQKHKLDELSSEKENLKTENKNLQDLLAFYEEAGEKPGESDPKDKEKIKELEIKIMNLEEKIKGYDDKIKEYDEKIIIKEESKEKSKDEEIKDKENKDKKENNKFEENKEKEKEYINVTEDGGVKKRIIREGTGDKAVDGRIY